MSTWSIKFFSFDLGIQATANLIFNGLHDLHDNPYATGTLRRFRGLVEVEELNLYGWVQNRVVVLGGSNNQFTLSFGLYPAPFVDAFTGGGFICIYNPSRSLTFYVVSSLE